MSYTAILYIYGFILISLISMHSISADVDDNEVSEGANESYLLQGVKVYQIDRQCAMVGGLCVPQSDCLEPTSNKGLCPSNSHRGVECCYELPVRPAPCAEHLGECMDRCHKTLMRPGTDCQNGQICCVLI